MCRVSKRPACSASTQAAELGVESCSSPTLPFPVSGALLESHLAGDLFGGGHVQEVAHNAPKGGAVGVALCKVEGAWACGVCIGV